MAETNLQENGSKRTTQLVLVLNITLAAETQEALVSALAAAARPDIRPVTTVGSPVAPAEDPWLGLRDAAQHLGVCTSTLYKYASQAKIASRKLAGRLQFRRSLLDRFMEEQVRPARRGARLRGIIPVALGSGK